MAPLIISVFAVSFISAVLAGGLAVSKVVFFSYGLCKIKINDKKELTVQGGQTLLSALTAEKIFIPSACGGKATCGLCKVKVINGAGEPLPTEEPFLSKEEIKDNIRLSCQIKIRNDISIQIPEYLFNIKEYTARVADMRDLTYDIKQFRLELISPAEIAYTPGQYIQLYVPPYPESEGEIYRAYSISSDPAEKKAIELVIRFVPGGICTTWCFKYLRPGDEVKFNGPYGEFHLSNTDTPMIFIAGGSGMAPMKCLLHQMVNTNNQRKCVYFFGGNTEKDLFYLELMKDFESRLPNFKFVPVVSGPQAGWSGQTGLVTEAVTRQFNDLKGWEGYLCGSPGLINACIKILTERGIPKEYIYYDSFA